MSTEPTLSKENVSPRRLWFGCAAAGCCWLGLEIACVLITWRACLHYEQYGGASNHPGLRALNIALFCALLLITIAAGLMSYTNWRRLSGDTPLLDAEGTGPREYFAIVGVFTSVTLGVGVIWFGIPVFMITLCSRIR